MCTTDFALAGSQALYKVAQNARLNASWYDTPAPYCYLIWRVFLGDFGSMLFGRPDGLCLTSNRIPCNIRFDVTRRRHKSRQISAG